MGALLRHFVPPSTLPTPISNGEATLESSETESPEVSLPGPTDNRFNQGTDN
jgi:hypothetical protein